LSTYILDESGYSAKEFLFEYKDQQAVDWSKTWRFCIRKIKEYPEKVRKISVVWL